MKTLVGNQKYLVLILVTVLIPFGTQSSYGQTITASVDTPLTEATLDGSVVALTLSGGAYERSIFDIRDAVEVSGIAGVTFHWAFGVDRVSDTKITVELEFEGNFDTDAMLTFTVGADAIENYNGPALTAEILVRAKSVIASTEAPLTETTLNGSVVTLTLHNGVYAAENIVGNAVTVSGITGVTIGTSGVQRVNDTEVTVPLEFDGTNFDTDKTLTFTVEADAISGYNGDALTDDISILGYIQGPWLWMIVPTDPTEVDSLAATSDGAVTEAHIAQNGVNEGDTVGQLQWISGTIASTVRTCRKFCGGGLFGTQCRTVCWENNLNDTANRLRFRAVGSGNMKAHTAYALIHLVSPQNQEGTLKVLSGDTFKVWLNGVAIHREVATNLGCRKVDIPFAFDRTDCTPDPRTYETRYSSFSFPVTLKAGSNLLLVQVSQEGEYWGMRVQLDLDADVTTSIPTAQDAEQIPTTQDTETTLMAIKGTITADGTSADAGLQVTVTIGSNTKTAVSETGGVYSVIFLNTAVVATSGDTVTVQVLNPNTGATTERTVQLSSEQITAKQATIDLQFSPSERKYLLSVPTGISLIHVPLKVTAVDGVAQTIESVSDLYDALGGASSVSLLITLDPQTQRWVGYFGSGDRGSSADQVLTDELGIIAVMTAPASVSLSGDGLGTNGHSTITLHPGMNLVGIPLNDSRITRVSDLLGLEGIKDNVTLTIVSDNGELKLTESAGDSGDIPVTGGQSFIMVAKRAATVAISGTGWSNVPSAAVAPWMALTGLQAEGVTPVLGVTGSISAVGERGRMPRLRPGLGYRVTVKNLSTGKGETAVADEQDAGYRFTFVDMEMGQAAQVGDILEITAQSPNPLIGVHPVRHTVTDEDVKRSLISLGELVAYEIPAKTEVLLNYPNPFNPETWIPYRLAADAFVRLTIYDQRGRMVRDIAVGHRIAAVYESRSKAIYWDGRTQFGERVASGIYFYTLTAGDYSATRKMVILK